MSKDERERERGKVLNKVQENRYGKSKKAGFIFSHYTKTQRKLYEVIKVSLLYSKVKEKYIKVSNKKGFRLNAHEVVMLKKKKKTKEQINTPTNNSVSRKTYPQNRSKL